MGALVVIRGGGDLATGVALRLRRAGLRVLMTELAEPLAVRRTVAFAEAIYEGRADVEGVRARHVLDPRDLGSIMDCTNAGEIPVLIDPNLSAVEMLQPGAIVDARMLKHAPRPLPPSAPLRVGLGPGFTAPSDCDAVVETERGHRMGRVIWSGSANPDSAKPEGDDRRVLRAPADGPLESKAGIGQHFEPGQVIASVGEHPVAAPFAGILRGLLRPGLLARKGMKIGDIDSRDDPSLCLQVSDKALAVGGGVLEALLTRPEARARLWD